jgi:tetratricopeptide (TPR) repeat protein
MTIGHGLAPPAGVWTLAQAEAERAIRSDSTLAEGWAILAVSKGLFERDWAGAEQAFRRAHELNPSLAENHYMFAWFLALFGNVEESLMEHTLAQELDPLIPIYTTLLPTLHWFSEDYERAWSEARDVAENQFPQDPLAHFAVGESAARLERFDEAIAAHETMVALFPPFVTHLGHTYARAGRTEDALRIVEELEAQPPSTWNAQGLALIHAALGNEERAMDWLEYEPAHAWLAWITTSWFPDFRGYRDKPRFQALLGRMNLRCDPGDRWPTPLPMGQPDTEGNLPPP